MTGGDSSSSEKGGGADVALSVVRDIDRISAEPRFSGLFATECKELVRRVSLLTHFVEEIRDCDENRRIGGVGSSSSYCSCFVELNLVLREAKLVLLAASNFQISTDSSSVMAQKRMVVRFQTVTIKLEKAFASFPYHDFEISEEAQEQVKLLRTQLRRAIEQYNDVDSNLLSHSSDAETDLSLVSNRAVESSDFENMVKIECQVGPNEDALTDEGIDGKECLSDSSTASVENSDKEMVENSTSKTEGSHQSPMVPVDFLCPISLELMRDPVIVATGQTYERSCIQRWIDCGNKTCPKTRQKLRHLSLTPNYLLRRLISQWCSRNNVRKIDGSFHEITGNVAAIRALVHKLCSHSVEDIRAAVAEIRSLSRRSTDNRILLAEAGAIPILVDLLTSQDSLIQENAITCILNLSIYENNKELIVLSDAIPLIVRVLETGSMEAKENAAATLFCLSLVDENKITIGASGAVPALIDLLRTGTSRGKKDAATALFSLCSYPRNKGRAIKAGIIAPLLNMITDSTESFLDESLTILAVLASYNEAKSAIAKSDMIPVLISVLKTGSSRNQENAASILVSLCKRGKENLVSVSRLGGVDPLFELSKNGTERARRKAAMLLELLGKATTMQHD